MSAEMSVLLLLLVLIQEGATIRPAMIFSPNYKKILTTESITMTCDGGSTIEGGPNYIWSKDYSTVYNGKSYTIQSARTSDSGSYRCQTRPGEISDPARLDVSNGWVILQTPPYVYEGDDINIRCHHRPGYSGGRTRFYRDNRIIRDWTDNAEYHIGNVEGTTAGTYRCEKDISGPYIYRDEAFFSVEELYSHPDIMVPNELYEGDPMILTCDMTISPHINHTEVRFAFYRDGREVQGFRSSNKYVVNSSHLEHSGKYACDAVTTYGRVRKRSAERLLQIEELFSHPEMTVTSELYEGNPMKLICHTTVSPHINPRELQFAFYRDGLEVQGFMSSNTYEVQFSHLKHSGKYSCAVETTDGRVRKRSAEKLLQIEELYSHPDIMVPNELYEGDPMILICDMTISPHINHTEVRFAFYKDGREVQGFTSSNKYVVNSSHLEHSGKYACDAVTTYGRVRKRSAERLLQIEELFSHPEMTVTSELYEGNPMNLTCHTTVSPRVNPTELQFAFYRDGQEVQGFMSSNTYEVQFSHLKHSGKYSCAVETTNGLVRKRSAEKLLQIEGRTDNMWYTRQNIVRLALSACVLIVAALFIFYHIKWMKSMEPADGSTT